MVLNFEETHVRNIRIKHSFFSCSSVLKIHLFLYVICHLRRADHVKGSQTFFSKGLKSYSISAIISMLSIPISRERLYLIKILRM